MIYTSRVPVKKKKRRLSSAVIVFRVETITTEFEDLYSYTHVNLFLKDFRLT